MEDKRGCPGCGNYVLTNQLENGHCLACRKKAEKSNRRWLNAAVIAVFITVVIIVADIMGWLPKGWLH